MSTQPEKREGAGFGPVSPLQVDEREVIARQFHERYERLAVDFGYETREASAVPWSKVPDQNRHLMLAVVGTLLLDGVIVPVSVVAARDEYLRHLRAAFDGEAALLKYEQAQVAALTEEVERRQAALDLLISDHDGVPAVWVCDRCGQPLGKDGRCGSGLHVGPGEEANGMAVATTDLVAERAQAQAEVARLSARVEELDAERIGVAAESMRKVRTNSELRAEGARQERKRAWELSLRFADDALVKQAQAATGSKPAERFWAGYAVGVGALASALVEQEGAAVLSSEEGAQDAE